MKATVPKHNEPPPSKSKQDELTPGPELSATPATGVAGPDVQSVPDVAPSKPLVPSSESVVKAPAPAPAPVPVTPKSAPRTTQDLTSAGWVALPGIGKLNLGREEDVDSVDGDVPGSGSGATTGRAPRTHSSDDVRFEEGSPQPLASVAAAPEAGERTTTGSAPGVGRARNAGSPRVQSNLHVVERNENFWSISQLYYYSGRYYRALWKANEARCPNIKGLHINDVIMIPAVEDLDPEYIDPPGAQARLARGTRKDDATDLAESASPTPRAATNRSSAAGIPVRRPLRNDAELDLPVSDTVSSSRNRTGRRASQSHVADHDDNDNDNDEPEIRVAARPRRTDSASDSASTSTSASASARSRRSVYKVRRYDTLRSIARDALGDSHRADEILDLNRDLIKDPSQLVVGQLLELPADAKTTSRR